MEDHGEKGGFDLGFLEFREALPVVSQRLLRIKNLEIRLVNSSLAFLGFRSRLGIGLGAGSSWSHGGFFLSYLPEVWLWLTQVDGTGVRWDLGCACSLGARHW